MQRAVLFAALAVLLAGCGATSATPYASPGKAASPHHHFTWIDMLSPTSGWALGSDRTTVYRTRNGLLWQAVPPIADVPQGGYGSLLYAMSPNDAWYAFAANASTVALYHTVDGGRRWTHQTIPFAPARQGYNPLGGPVSMSFANREDGWLMVAQSHGMSTEPGALYRTVDGGKTWRAVASTGPVPVVVPTLPFNGDVSFTGPQDGWLVGSETTTSPSMLYRTTDGGAHWTRVSFPVPGGLPEAEATVIAGPTFSGRRGAMAVQFLGTGESFLYESGDGGTTWESTRGGRSLHGNSPLVDLVSVVPQILAFTYSPGGLDVSRVYGNTWTDAGVIPASDLKAGGQVAEIDFVNRSDGWAIITHPFDAAAQPVVLRTEDGGKTWIRG